MSTLSIKALVVEAYKKGMTNPQEIACHILETIPGSKTTAASISTILSVARRNGEITPAAVEKAAGQSYAAVELPEDTSPEETDEQIEKRLNARFEALSRLTRGVLNGVVPSLIISGPAGIGKSHGVRTELIAKAAASENFYYDIISGSATAVGLYIALWNAREKGVVILDDCDDIFHDETALNVLKAALDSHEVRTISWRKQAHWLKELDIPNSFDFKGQVIFLTNVDFERAAASSNKANAVHYRALMDRSLYLSLGIASTRDVMIRIKTVIEKQAMLEKIGLEPHEVEKIMDYLNKHKAKFHNLSLRLAYQIGICYMADNENWEEDISLTKMKNHKY